MGFSVAATFGPHIFFRNCCEKPVNFPSFGHKEGHRVNFKLSEFKPRPRRISASKPEVFQFEERTSPNEVIPIL